jgi:methionine-rich copper-binding protein CopC
MTRCGPDQHWMRAHRLRCLSVLASALALGGATTASAHTEVKSTSPASGTTVKTSITRVTVTFTGPLEGGTLRVTGPDGKAASVSNGGRDPRKISRLLVGLKRSLKAGSYTASWTILAADGHKQKGAFRFKLKR